MKFIKTNDGLYTIYSDKYKQTYHSKHGVYQEADHVFLKGSAVTEKMQTAKKLTVLETGFGTGFNFFLTAQLASERQSVLHYYALENNLPGISNLMRLKYDSCFSHNPAWESFLNWRKHTRISARSVYEIDSNDIKLILYCGDAREKELPCEYFDAVYHDAFSPLVNPELWTVSYFTKIWHAMKKGAKLSTYSAKGSVKRAMAEVGFEVQKIAGPIGKRDMLVALKA